MHARSGQAHFRPKPFESEIYGGGGGGGGRR